MFLFARVAVLCIGLTFLASPTEASSYNVQIRFSCDDAGWLYINGVHVKDVHGWTAVGLWTGKLTTGAIVMVKGKDAGGVGGGYGCKISIKYLIRGAWLTLNSNTKSWRGTPLHPAWERNLHAFLRRRPIRTWPPASNARSHSSVLPGAVRIWSKKPHGACLLATKFAPRPAPVQLTGFIKFNCDDKGWLFINGNHVLDVHGWNKIGTWKGHLKENDHIVIKGQDLGGGYGCNALVAYKSRQGKWAWSITNTKSWSAVPLDPAWAKKVRHFLRTRPVTTWPGASKGTSGVKVVKHAEFIWSKKPHGLALMGTVLGRRIVRPPPVRPPPVRPTGSIKFNCDDKGWLFINGKHVLDLHGWNKIATWRGHLKENDHIVIKGQDLGGGYGCNAVISYKDRRGRWRKRATDRTSWGAVPLDPAWAKKVRHFLRTRPVTTWPGASRGTSGVKVNAHAHFIWSNKPHGLALIGTVLGRGPIRPPPVRPPPVRPTGSIKFNCDDKGWLFINGKHVLDVHGWNKIATWRGHLKENDHIVIKGQDLGGGHGCNAVISYKDRRGRWRKRVTDRTSWGAVPLDPAWAKKVLHFLRTRPVTTWPGASRGTSGVKVDAQAHFIWSNKPHGLALMGTVLGRGLTSGSAGIIKFSCDDQAWLFKNGKHLADVRGFLKIGVWRGPVKTGDVIGIKGKDLGGGYGCTASISYRDARGIWRVKYSGHGWRGAAVFPGKNGHRVGKWTAAKKAPGGRKVHPLAHRIWGPNPHGLCLLAVKLH